MTPLQKAHSLTNQLNQRKTIMETETQKSDGVPAEYKPLTPEIEAEIRGHSELRTVEAGVRAADYPAINKDAEKSLPQITFEQAVEVVKARMLDELAKLAARPDATLSMIEMDVIHWLVSKPEVRWFARADIGEKRQSFKTLDDAIAAVPPILTAEQKAARELERLEAEIAELQSQRAKLEVA